jgi:hypothetical protein
MPISPSPSSMSMAAVFWAAKARTVSALVLALAHLLAANPSVVKRSPSESAGRSTASDTARLADSLVSKIQNRPSYIPFVLEAVRNKSPKVRAALRKAFDSGNHEEKLATAQVLLFLHDTSSTYFDTMKDEIEKGLQLDIPFPVALETDCDPKIPKISQEFSEWCTRNNCDSSKAIIQAFDKIPGSVLNLAVVGDSRAGPIFLMALASRNSLVVLNAAIGLARINDSNFIDPIIKAVSRSGRCMRPTIARNLVYFDNPRSQAAAKKFMGSPDLYNDALGDWKKYGYKALLGI